MSLLDAIGLLTLSVVAGVSFFRAIVWVFLEDDE